MPKLLSEEQVDRYARDGFLAPIDVLTPEEARHYREQLEAYEAAVGGAPLDAEMSRKVHVREPWAAELVRHPRVLDALEDLIGPDILLFTSTLFIKEAGSDQITGWHQDAAYLGLRPHLHMNVWIALSEASEAAGCIRFLPGSTSLGLLDHGARAVKGSVNHGGQKILGDLSLDDAVAAPLAIGQMSVHHTLSVHGSEPNRSTDRRIGFSLSVIPARCAHQGSRRMYATVLRGKDRLGHFTPEPDPREHDTATNVANHARCYRRYREGYEEQIARHAAQRD